MTPDRPVDEGTPDLALIAATDAMLDRLAARRPTPSDLDDPAAAVLALLATEVDQAWVGPERLYAEYFGPAEVLPFPSRGADLGFDLGAAPTAYPTSDDFSFFGDDAVVAHDAATEMLPPAPSAPSAPPAAQQSASLWDSVDWGARRPAEPDATALLDGGAPWQYDDGRSVPQVPAARSAFASAPAPEPRRVRVRLVAVAAVAAAALWGVGGVVTGAWNPFRAGTIIAGQDDGAKAVDLLEDGLALVSLDKVAAEQKLEQAHALVQQADLTDDQRAKINELMVRLSTALQSKGVRLPPTLTPDAVVVTTPDDSAPAPKDTVAEPGDATTSAPSTGADESGSPDATDARTSAGSSSTGSSPTTSKTNNGTSSKPTTTTTTEPVATTTTEPESTRTTRGTGKPTKTTRTRTKSPKGEADGES